MGIGVWQIALILVIVLIVFGAGKLPRVMGDFAKGIKSFKAGLKEEDQEEADAKREVTKESEQPAAAAATAEVKSDEPVKG